jgi:hypothetical protein
MRVNLVLDLTVWKERMLLCDGRVRLNSVAKDNFPARAGRLPLE